MKTILFLSVLLALVGCGTSAVRVSGIEEFSSLVVRGERLEGLTVLVDENFRSTIQKKDLIPFKEGILGVADSEIEGLQSVKIRVDSGLRRIKILSGMKLVLERELQFGNGQTRELRI